MHVQPVLGLYPLLLTLPLPLPLWLQTPPKSDKLKLDGGNPFDEEEDDRSTELASVAYRYHGNSNCLLLLSAIVACMFVV